MTSMRSLRQKLNTFAMCDETLDVLSDLNEDAWYWLHRGRMCGMTVHDLWRVTALNVKQRGEALRAQDFRIDVNAFEVLKSLTEAEWTALAITAEYPVSENIVGMLDALDTRSRVALRSVAQKLGDSAAISALASMKADDWDLLREHWHASASDWNHVRRALAKCLSVLLDGSWHPFRRMVIERIPLGKEHARLPNVDKDTLQQISAHLPEPVRQLTWFLVLSGLRISEYLRLERGNLNQRSHSISVPGTKSTSSVREVFIESELWWVADAAVPCHYASYRAIRKQWVAACAAAGVYDLTLHDLRHCSAQFAVEAGADQLTVQRHLGHATLDQSAKYFERVGQAQGARKLGTLLLPFVSQ